LGGCVLYDGRFLEITKATEILGPLFSMAQVMFYYDKMVGRFFTCSSVPGLQVCIFENQKSHFWHILYGLEAENVGIFYDHLEYFMTIWNFL
jgi:hypothetical protein